MLVHFFEMKHTNPHNCLLAILLFVNLSLFSQSYNRCSSNEVLQAQLAADPTLKLRMDQIESFSYNFIQNSTTQRIASGSSSSVTGAVSIPVVFHVLYNAAAENISDAVLQKQLSALNADFSGSNSDISTLPAAFAAIKSGNTGIQFCLAQRDPNGNATTGIVRKSTTVTAFTSDDKVKFPSAGGDTAWDATKYLNIWICNLSNGLLGYAQFPGGVASTDGVVILYSSLPGGTSSPYNQGRTMTHEIGHWLNLRHIWGDASCGDDLVSDTPTQQSSNFGCPTFPHITCSNGSNGDLYMNYMDYTDDACMYMFSAGQSSRMNALFATGGARASLATSNGCVAPVSCGVPTALASASITTTGATVSWAAVTGATSYTLQYKTSTATTWTTVSGITTTSKALTGLTANTVYSYQVMATCTAGASAYSTAATFTTLSSCGTPTSLKSASITTTGATLSWAAVTGATSYTLQYKTASATTWTTVSRITTTSKALTGLTANTVYSYQVMATCTAGASAYSTAATFTTLSSCGTPTSLKSASITTTGATLSWAAVTGATSYTLQYKTASATTWTTVTGITTASRSLTGLTASTTYSYQVMATCTAGASAYSTVSSFTTLTPCGVPAGLGAASITTTGATVSWGAVTGAINYTLQYKASTATAWIIIRGITTTSRALTGLLSGTTYSFQVLDSCSSGLSAYSTASTFTTLTACGVPASLTAASITSSSATLSWAAITGATSYTLQYKVSTATTWTTVSGITTTSSALTGLTASTIYNYQVSATCASGASAYSTVASFTTIAASVTYCASNGTSQAYEWIDLVKLKSINRTSGLESGGYLNTRLSTDLPIGSVNDTIYFSPGLKQTTSTVYWKVYIDYNMNGLFTDTGELVYSATTTGSITYSGVFNVPSGLASGLTRMRVILSNAAITSPCGTFSRGEVEDYTINLVASLGIKGGEAIPSTTAFRSADDFILASPVAEQKEVVSIVNDEILSLYPNPVIADDVQVKFSISHAGNVGIKLLDILGRIVLEDDSAGYLNEGEHLHTLSRLENLTKGTYVLIIVEDGQMIMSSRLSKVR